MVDLLLQTHPMNLIIPGLVMVLTVFAGYLYLTNRRDGTFAAKDFFHLKYDRGCVWLAAAMLAGAVGVFVKSFLLDGDSWLRAIMHGEVLIWLSLAGYIDFREKIIPNVLIVAGLLFWVALVLLSVFLAGTPLLPLLGFSALGGIVCGGVLLIIATIAKSALGMGDVKQFFVLGLLYGMSDAYGILLFTVIALGAASIVLLLARKVTMKSALPMAPFAVIGFLLSIFAGM